MATEQNNWVTPNRPTRVKRNTVTALVLTASEEETESYAKKYFRGDIWIAGTYGL